MAFSYHFNVSAALVKIPPAPTQRTRVPLIVGTHTVFAERARIYSALDDMVTDGFATSDPEYVMAAAMIANPSTNDGAVARWFVGRRATEVANVWNVEVVGTADGVMNLVDSQTGVDVVIATFVAGNVWTFDIGATADGTQNILDGVTVISTFVSSGNTATQIRDGMIAALVTGYTATIVDADTFSIKKNTGAVMTITVTGTAAANITDTETIAAAATTEGQIRDGLIAALIAAYTDAVVDADEFSITNTVAGVPIVLSVTGTSSANLTISETTPEVGIADDLDAIIATVIDSLPVAVQTWGIFVEAGSLGTGGIVEAAKWGHLQSLSSSGRGYGIFVQSTDVEIFDPGVTDDPASLVRDLGYTRTCIAYRAVSTDPIHCRAAGRVIPSEPGTVNWNQRIMVGSTSTTAITFTQNGTFATKRASYSEPFKTGATSEVRFIGGRDGTNRQMCHWAAIDAWRDDMERIVSFQTANSDGIDMTLDGLEIGYGAPLRSEMDRMVAVGRLASTGTITFVDPEDIPDAEILAGDYQTTGGITISAVLRVFAERVAVSGTFSI